MTKQLRDARTVVAVLCLLVVAVPAGAVTVFSADFDNGYVLGALNGQPGGHGVGDPYWSVFPDASDAMVTAGIGVGGSRAAKFTWNYTGSPIVASDENILDLSDPGRASELEYSMDVNFANSEPNYALLVQCMDASQNVFATVSFGNGYYLEGSGNPYVGLAVDASPVAQVLSAATYSRNAYHYVVMKVKFDVYGTSPKDTAEVWVDGAQAIAPQRFDAPALGAMDLWVDGDNDTAFGPIYVDNLSIVSATLVGDVNGDGHVDVADLLYFVDAFGSVIGDPNYSAACDFNSDDSVDVVDLLMLVDNFGL